MSSRAGPRRDRDRRAPEGAGLVTSVCRAAASPDVERCPSVAVPVLALAQPDLLPDDLRPDIDSLSTRLLGLLGRAQTGLDNAARLKGLTRHRARVDWDLLCGIPGEARLDYARQGAWLERIVHLRPPRRLRPLEYGRCPAALRRAPTSRLAPAAWYADVFPADQIELARIAVEFDVVWRDVLDPAAYLDLRRRVAEWQRRWRGDLGPPALIQRRVAGGLELEDTRGPRPILWRLDPRVADLYAAIAEPTGVDELAGTGRRSGLTDDRLRGLLRSLCAAGLALAEDDRYLALALPAHPGDPPFPRAVAERRAIAGLAASS